MTFWGRGEGEGQSVSQPNERKPGTLCTVHHETRTQQEFYDR